MRATDIGIKSHKEFTPCSTCPVVNNEGSTVALSKAKGGFSFGGAKRFSHYLSDAQKSGFRVGPGSYELKNKSIGSSCKNSVVYKSDLKTSHLPVEGFYRSGNLLMFNERLLNTRQRKSLKNISIDQGSRSNINSARDSEMKNPFSNN